MTFAQGVRAAAVSDRESAPACEVRPEKPAQGNEDFPWDSFDAHWYVEHNYRKLHDNDRQILGWLAEFFGAVDDRALRRGIDVGTGTNLYPALAMLPLCHKVTLRERSATNHAWLLNEVKKYSDTWDPYWEELTDQPLYRKMRDPRWALHDRVRVERGNLFNLPKDQFDIGTMFFVAESITARRSEFERAMRCFIRSLKSYAPFAAAFMRNSQGYEVKGVHFPAVAITEQDVEQCLHGEVARGMRVDRIEITTPLRDGYDGMVLVRGRAARR